MKNKTTKAAKSTETVVHAAAPKKGAKRGRKAGAVSKSTVANFPNVQNSTRSAGQDDLFLFSEARNNLQTLAMLQEKFPDVASIKTEVAAHVDIMSDLRKRVFGQKDNTEAAQPIVSKAASNGTAQTTAYPAVAPLPAVAPAIVNPTTSH
jgi:hypothetical protein